MSKNLLDLAINTETLELHIDGVHLRPVQSEFNDAQQLRSSVWNLYHYLIDMRDELREWRDYHQKLQDWLGHEPHEPARADRRLRR